MVRPWHDISIYGRNVENIQNHSNRRELPSRPAEGRKREAWGSTGSGRTAQPRSLAIRTAPPAHPSGCLVPLPSGVLAGYAVTTRLAPWRGRRSALQFDDH